MTDIPEDVLEAARKCIPDKMMWFRTETEANIARALIADRAAQAERMARLEEALRGDWHGVFLDGRNEHGSHVLNLPQRSIELEQNSEGYFLPDEAEAILLDAEAKGFRAGDHGVVLVFDRCTDEGWFSHYEFKEVSPELTALLYGTPAEQDARALSQEGSDARAWPSGCLKPSSCERHKACMYVGCPNEGRDIENEVDAAILRAAEESAG